MNGRVAAGSAGPSPMRPPISVPVRNDDEAELSVRRAHGRETLATVAQRVRTPSTPSTPNASIRSSSGDNGSGGNQTGDTSFNRRATGRFRPPQAQEDWGEHDFDEWMRLLRTNRLKPQDSFQVHLIDYFYRKVFGGGDLGSISGGIDSETVNFQEVTYLFNNCVKVYKSRITSVTQDTRRLYDGILEGRTADLGAGTDESNGVHNEDGDNNGNDDGDDHETNGQTQRRRRRPARGPSHNSYLSPPEKLMIDTSELETTIDPLFRKMCADFDQRGARGMLQYSLHVEKGGRFLLDTVDDYPIAAPSSNSAAEDGGSPRHEETEMQVDQNTLNENSETAVPNIVKEDPDASSMVVDEASHEGRDYNFLEDEALSKQDNSLIPDGEAVNDTNKPRNRLEGAPVDLVYLKVQYFGSGVNDLTACPSMPLIAEAIHNPMDDGQDLMREVQTSWGQHDFDDVGLGPDNSDNEVPDAEYEADPSGDAESNAADAEGAIDTSVVSIQTPPSGNWLDSNMFEQMGSQSSNWAGAVHWKVQRLRERRAAEAASGETVNEAHSERPRTTTSRRGQHREPLSIRFNEPPLRSAVLSQGSESSMQLNPAYVEPGHDPRFLLPKDMHLTLRKFASRMGEPPQPIQRAYAWSRRRRVWPAIGSTAGAPDAEENMGQEWNELHENAAAEASLGDGLLDDGNMEDQPAGYDADFFAGGVPDDVPGSTPPDSDTPVPGMSAMSQLMALARQSEQLNFARTIQRIDVRTLKELMWSEMRRETAAAETNKAPPTLLSVMRETAPRYSHAMGSNGPGNEPSRAMYFLSTLHLANEHGIHLESTPDLNDVVLTASS